MKSKRLKKSWVIAEAKRKEITFIKGRWGWYMLVETYGNPIEVGEFKTFAEVADHWERHYRE